MTDPKYTNLELDPRIFDTEESESRRCPRCRDILPTYPVEVAREFWCFYRTGTEGNLRRKTYCRRCTVALEKIRRQERREGILPRRAQCDACGMIRSNCAHHTEDATTSSLCPWCLWMLNSHGWQVAGKDGLLVDLVRHRAHNRREAEAEAGWRADRKRTPHRGIRFGEWVPADGHAECVERERHLEAAVGFLRGKR